MTTPRAPAFFIIITVAVILYNVFLLANAAESVQAAKNGLLLWFNQVLPTLFPFAVGANLLLGLGFARILGRIIEPAMFFLFRVSGAGGFAFLTGLISGYPMGAKITAALRTSGELSQEEAQRLLCFVNNSGPLFIIGFAAGLFGSVRAGQLILVSHIASAVLVGVVLGLAARRFQPVTACNRLESSRESAAQSPIIGGYSAVFADSIKNAMESMVLVGGYIILFSVLTYALSVLPFTEFLEISTGTKIAADRNSIPLAAAVISFGGLSVHAQTAHFLRGTGLRMRPYFVAKALQGGVAFGVCLVVDVFFGYAGL